MADNPAPITRRDFLNGIPIAVGGAVAAGLSPEYIAAAFADGPAPQDAPGYYPPALTGLRGSHPGAYEAAHRLRDGDFWSQAGNLKPTSEDYDLIVVGGGISGLAAAHFYRAEAPGRPHPHPRQPRRFRRPRQAQRVFARWAASS